MFFMSGKLSGRKIGVQRHLLLLGIVFVRHFWIAFSNIFDRSKGSGLMNLRQGNMIVQKYGLMFKKLSRYAPLIVSNSRA